MLWAEDWTDADRLAIRDALVGLDGTRNEFPKSWADITDWQRVYDQIMAGRFNAVIVDGYLLLFHIQVPWYAKAGCRVFEEHLILRLGDRPGRFLRVVDAMEAIAVANGCVGIAVGTALCPTDGPLTRVYSRRGYVAEANTLYKDLNNGKRSS